MGYSLTTRLSSPLAQINEHYMSSLVVLAKGTGDKCMLHRRRRWASRTTDALHSSLSSQHPQLRARWVFGGWLQESPLVTLPVSPRPPRTRNR